MRSEYQAEFEFRASSKIEIRKKLQLTTLHFDLDMKYIFDSNLTLSEANIELSLNFEPARRSKLEKGYK